VVIDSNVCAKRSGMSNCLFLKKMLEIWEKTREGVDNFWSVKVQECNLYVKVLFTPQRKPIMKMFLLG
jgi:hypothetical protein